MPLYNEQTIEETTSKTLYEYAYKVEVDNPLKGSPVISFVTAQVERNNDTGEENYIEHKRVIKEAYETNEVFDVINPLTKAVEGQMDYDTVFAALYSLFFHVAAKSDSLES